MVSPPPPYSPQRTQEVQAPYRSNVTPSPSDIMSPETDYSCVNTPISAATSMSTYGPTPQPGRGSPRSAVQNRVQVSPATRTPAVFPPPPPSSSNRARSTSKNHADRLLAAMTLRGKTGTTASTPSAIDTLQQHTAHVLARTSDVPQGDAAFRPPASRRAASAGAISINASSSRFINEGHSTNVWEPGLPLPPPPPGPPPIGMRSQSLSRAPESSMSQNLSAIRNRHALGRGTDLETIPPTPADWREESGEIQNTWPKDRQLHLNTKNLGNRSSIEAGLISPSIPTLHPASSHARRESSSGNLIRSPAVRNRSAKGIRERRNESRNGRSNLPGDQEDTTSNSSHWTGGLCSVKPSDLVLPTSDSSLLRRRTSNKSSPRSAKNIRGLDEALNSAHTKLPSAQTCSFGSLHSTPRESACVHESQDDSTQTPPFSPGGDTNPKSVGNNRVSNKTLPTSPLQRPRGLHTLAPLNTSPANPPRPVSHLLNTPNPEVPIEVLALSPKSTRSMTDVNSPESPTTFADRAIERHRNFAACEAAASSDSERLHLFTQYMIAESRIRRNRYASTFDDEDITPAELTMGMFEKLHPSVSHADTEPLPPNPENVEPSPENSRRSSGTSFSESRSRNDSTTATSDLILTTDSSSIIHQVEPSRWNDYVPCLSPIASMSAVTGRDEMDSRGRAPSRWWETESHLSSHEDGFKVLERSKRESKYMGVPHEIRNSPALYENRVSQMDNFYSSEAGTSQPPVYGPSEYPPEKGGWHDEGSGKYSNSYPPTPHSAPYTPDPRKLDISRLVTLPPPYPRHHPAVNNNHPELADVRTIVRSLHDVEEAKTVRQAYEVKLGEKRQRADSWSKHQRSLHSQDIQYRMENNEISEEEFDRAEAEIEAKEAKSQKEIVQVAFDLFQDTVVSPLHALHAERITIATSSFDRLSTRLFSDAQSHSPNLPQEEGDEQPELLEKLTQLKWLFEARETLHRETYELLSERNDKYKAVILLPYQQQHNHEKIADAESFFKKDHLSRKIAFESAALTRFESFRTIIESHVTRGVEIQLSAFWDIAPPLHSLLQQVPLRRLGSLDILIPRQELDENAIYWTHPLRYLYSLVSHAENSSRQFIESQVSLWCLLQEVREATTGAKWRLTESRGDTASGESVEKKKKKEEKEMLDDLKEKVGVVEGQWEESLGGRIRAVKERVKAYLEERGGWDEELEGV